MLLGMSGSQIAKEIEAMGMSVAAFSRLADISIPALNRVFKDQNTQKTSYTKVLNAFNRLKAQQMAVQATG